MTVDREAILREWAGRLDQTGYALGWLDTERYMSVAADELIHLISRAVDAACEDAARVVEGESLHDNTGDPFDLAYMEGITDAAAAIRALIGGGE